MSPIILMDLDGTVLDFNSAFGDHLRKLGMEVPKDFIPWEPFWEKDELFKGKEDEVRAGYLDFVDSGFKVDPIPGAEDFLEKVAKNFEIVYCTSRHHPEQIKATFDLIYNKFPLGSIIFTQDKASIAKAMDPLCIMEDMPHHIKSLKPYCKNIIVPRARYNNNPPISGVHYIWNFDDSLKLLDSILARSE